ncbi:MAG: hypothetical protein QE484_04250 [Rhizobium sp.]|nr:hypothetical protein [Rhizobium sp.]
MPKAPFQTLRDSLARLMTKSRARATRAATRQALRSLSPALREDLGLTRHRQYIIFQNDKHQKHSFD